MKTLAAFFLAVVATLIVCVALLTQDGVGTSEAAGEIQTTNIGCSEDIDNAINGDPAQTATRFVLGSCTYTTSITLRPQSGDEIVGVAGTIKSRAVRGTYPDGLTSKIVASSGLPVIAKPQGQFYSEWIDWSGATFDGTSGSGVAIAGGAMADSSVTRTSRFHDNEGVGVSNAHGTFIDVEADNNGSLDSLGFISGGIKATDFIEVSGGYYHSNIGNGVWCDAGCDASRASAHPNGFYVHDAELSDNAGAGARYENSTTKALIENSHIWGNSTEVNRAGITIRDAQNATVRNNVFDGAGFAHNQAPDNIAIRADSGGRIATKNILIESNDLNGEKIKTCGGPVICRSNQ